MSPNQIKTWFKNPVCLVILAFVGILYAPAQQGPFHIEEASITDIQNAFRSGRTTCVDVVRAYLVRASAYNGVCTALVTKDGAAIPQSTGMVRAGSPLKYPSATVPVSSIFPEFDQYQGPPFELGRMVTSVSDPTVQLQYGLRVGIRRVSRASS